MAEATLEAIQYVSDREGNLTGVFVPIEVWREIESELETQYLLQSPVMRKPLLEALGRDQGLSLEETLEKFRA
jgi:hypothetical protein